MSDRTLVRAPVPPGTVVRERLTVTGRVQGVGFRPFVFRLATRLGVTGQVANTGEGVAVEVEGSPEAVAAFRAALGHDAPPRARLDTLDAVAVPPRGDTVFAVAGSSPGPGAALAPPDVAVCPACRAEIGDPADRRYGHAFASCVDCGPRFTVITALPYDRRGTTMAGFPLCPACAAEYSNPADRRFSAETVACPDCGPQLTMTVDDAAAVLRAGGVLAVKALGGFHLACDATSAAAVDRLRAAKQRDAKPFAVMVADLEAAEELASIGPAERELLASPAGPIVLADRRPGALLAEGVAPGLARLGIFVPTTPLHSLLLRAAGRPLVMTSANLTDCPTAWREQDVAALAGVADAVLSHDRPIAARADDSVATVIDGAPVLLRRSRGHVPDPLPLPVPASRPLLAVGGHLKNTVCVARGRQAFLSAHVGDLSTAEAERDLADAAARLIALAGVDPELVAHDLHPEYRSTAFAHRLGLPALAVQHHHAHAAACLADNGVAGPAVAVVADGTGLGTDGTLWGGEILVAGLTGFDRAGHIAPVALPGGEAAVRSPWRMAVSYLQAGFGEAFPDRPVLDRLPAGAPVRQVAALVRSGLAPATTGLGRLFDAVAAVAGVRAEAGYEGQAAIELEQVADPDEAGAFPCPVVAGADGLLVDTLELFRAVVHGLEHGLPVPTVAARFHNGLAAGLATAAARVARDRGLDQVTLSGGCMQNRRLVSRLAAAARAEGLDVLTHSSVPPNDGGLSLGQAAVAAALSAENLPEQPCA